MNNDIDWGSLTFGYIPTDYNVRSYFRNGQWGPIEVSDKPTVDVHIAATGLHYGQEIFEGMKAFRGKDGKIRIFRLEENAKRMIDSANGLLMAPIPVELFREMVIKAVKLNERFVPPYGTGASLYIRPVEFGVSPAIGVKPGDEYCFIVLVTPVGPYFKSGFKPTNICITREYDRVAPKGTGRWKVGGNYAASLGAGEMAHSKGYSAVLYLDPREKTLSRRVWPGKLLRCQGQYVYHTRQRLDLSITNRSFSNAGYGTEGRSIAIFLSRNSTLSRGCRLRNRRCCFADRRD